MQNATQLAKRHCSRLATNQCTNFDFKHRSSMAPCVQAVSILPFVAFSVPRLKTRRDSFWRPTLSPNSFRLMSIFTLCSFQISPREESPTPLGDTAPLGSLLSRTIRVAGALRRSESLPQFAAGPGMPALIWHAPVTHSCAQHEGCHIGASTACLSSLRRQGSVSFTNSLGLQGEWRQPILVIVGHRWL